MKKTCLIWVFDSDQNNIGWRFEGVMGGEGERRLKKRKRRKGRVRGRKASTVLHFACFYIIRESHTLILVFLNHVDL